MDKVYGSGMTTNTNIYRVTNRRGIRRDVNQSQLRDDMERAGLRYSELMAHIADVDAGYVVTAENGTTFTLSAGDDA
jgi:hypothetical protein